ncbi:TetR/AcrR family transcriptional regulator [Haloechinothrix sp. LS1_15]|uniref:TetR/AcrR family transcriptional regulator n=1 Tax=Haloechinothrix sp. LS1_15 TaxID=2652248 RepID=UPI002946813A|nr:TetR/AcrR family transcriptional regulator [Haloechinothrix sp. LS1_15]MDV6012884.1 TetR/AcrR family transcriptional regulator [Haloechinothrix sp. LS1_15]
MLKASDSPADGRAARWKEHNQQRRAEVVEAAVNAIEDEGIDVSVRRIAQRLNLPRPVVYRHFDGREDLDEQVRRRIVEMLLAELTPTLVPDGTLRDAIRHAVGTYLAWIDRHPRLHHFLITGSRDRQAVTSRAVTGARTTVAARIERLVAAGLDAHGLDADLARPTAFGMLGLVDAVVNGWHSGETEALTSTTLTGFLTTSLCSMLSGNARAVGIELDPDTPLRGLLGE